MILSSFKEDENPAFKPEGLGIVMFAISVSLDSFSLGLTLGIFGAQLILSILLFGLFATILTWVGLISGKKMKSMFGKYSEALGGAILLIFGFKLIFPL